MSLHNALRTLPIWPALALMSLFVFAGCAAAYQAPALSTQHPAHPEAMAAPQAPRSTTLASGPADLPAPQPAMQMAQRGMPDAHGAHGQQGAASARPESQQTVVGEGKVIAVVPSSQQIVLDHQAIPGFMDAMTMGYQVHPPSLVEGVQAGETVRFTIDTEQRAIIHLEKIP